MGYTVNEEEYGYDVDSSAQEHEEIAVQVKKTSKPNAKASADYRAFILAEMD